MSLNIRQRSFVEHYEGNAAEAARRAGYSVKTARAIGQRLLTNVDIQKAIQEREAARLSSDIATRERRLQFWTQVMDAPEADMRDRLRASELLGKAEGDFLQRVEASVSFSPASILEAIRQRRRCEENGG